MFKCPDLFNWLNYFEPFKDTFFFLNGTHDKLIITDDQTYSQFLITLILIGLYEHYFTIKASELS